MPKIGFLVLPGVRDMQYTVLLLVVVAPFKELPIYADSPKAIGLSYSIVGTSQPIVIDDPTVIRGFHPQSHVAVPDIFLHF